MDQGNHLKIQENSLERSSDGLQNSQAKILNKKGKKNETKKDSKSKKKKKSSKIPLNDIEMEGGSSLGSGSEEETKNQEKQINNSRFS